MKGKKMIKKILFVITLIISANLVYSQNDTSNVAKEFRTIQQNAFAPGEKLVFDVNYGFVKAGEAVMEIDPILQYVNGRKAYDIKFTVISTSTFDWVYKVRDRYRSLVDAEGLFPWKFEQSIREGNFSRDFEAIFDHENLKAKTYTGEKDPKKFEGEFDIPIYVQDILSAFYFSRTLDYRNMKVGDVVKLQNFYKEDTYPLDVKFLGKEEVKVPAGTFKTIKVEPMVQEGGLFKSEGSIVVWLTDDDRKIPVKVKTKVLIGSIDADLTSFSGLAGPLTARVR
jgi:hypothetical protein